MASLTQSSVAARKVIRYSLYSFILILIVRFVFYTALDLYKKYFPEKPKATLAFGKLPSLPFPENKPVEGLTYTLELPQNRFPSYGDLATIYFMPPSQRSITALEDARIKAISLGFSPQEKSVAETIPNVYVFQHPKEPSNFTINIVTGIFSIGYNFDTNPLILSQLPPNVDEAKNLTYKALKTADSLPKEIEEGSSNVSFIKINDGLFTNVTSLSEANLTRVDVFRKNYGEKKDITSISPSFPNSNLWFMFTGGSKNIAVGEYHYYPIDETRIATYPLKSTDIAWQEITSGKGYILNPGAGVKNAVIRRVYIAYYDAGQYTSFYQPVYVFEGDGGFAVVVPAVTNEYYGAAQQ